MTKESLLERIISTSVETADAARLLAAALEVLEPSPADARAADERLPTTSELARELVPLFAALLEAGRNCRARRCHLNSCKDLARQPLLYVPLAKGGNPQEIVAVRVRQHAIQDLARLAAAAGPVGRNVRAARSRPQMERDHPVGPGAVTEFDELFKIGYRAIVESLVASSQHVAVGPEGDEDETPPRRSSRAWSSSPSRCSRAGSPTAARCGSACWSESTTRRAGRSWSRSSSATATSCSRSDS